MGHRPADARLLSHLVQHEKDASKARQTLNAASQSALASLSAYAAASPPATSRTILNVAAVLSAADSAHAAYAAAVDEWRDMLRALHVLEEEVGNVIRDREILVTRLIKASNKISSSISSAASHHHLHLRSPSGSSLNLNRLPSLPSSTKLAAAQSELQACEAHLAAKERELQVRRVQVIRDGLTLRGKAMADTGWTWSQLGQETINVVETELGFREARPREPSSTHIPGDYPPSNSEEGNVSTKAGELRIPAAHAISSEIDMPIPFMNSANNTPAPSRRNSTSFVSPRNSILSSGPPVPGKRHSIHSTTPRPSKSDMNMDSTPHPSGSEQQHRPHLHQVAPRGRVSSVSVTDTEDDWVDAAEGGEELDGILGTPKDGTSPQNTNGNGNAATSDNVLPTPPLLSLPYTYASAPGSLFDSEAYRASMQEVRSASSKAPTSALSPTSPPSQPASSAADNTAPSSTAGSEIGTARHKRNSATQRDSTPNSSDGSESLKQASLVEYVGSAQRYTIARAASSSLKVVRQAEGPQSEEQRPPPPPQLRLPKAPSSAYDSARRGEEESEEEEEQDDRSAEVGEPNVQPTANPVFASLPPPIPFSTLGTSTSPLLQLKSDTSLPPQVVSPTSKDTDKDRDVRHVLARSITEESGPIVQVRNRSIEEAREARTQTAIGEEGAEGGATAESAVVWTVVENPKYAAVSSNFGVTQDTVSSAGAKRMSSIRSALLAPVAGSVVDHEEKGATAEVQAESLTVAAKTVQKDSLASSPPPPIPAPIPASTTGFSALHASNMTLQSQKQTLFSRIFSRKERRGSVGSASDPNVPPQQDTSPPPPVPNIPANYVNPVVVVSQTEDVTRDIPPETGVLVRRVTEVLAEPTPEPLPIPVVLSEVRDEQRPRINLDDVREPVVDAGEGSKQRGSKLLKRQKEDKDSGSPAKPSGFLGGLRGFFGADLVEAGDGTKAKGGGLKRKGGPESGALVPTATETDWTAPVVYDTGASASESGSPKKKQKHQRSSSRGTFGALFGLNQPKKQDVVRVDEDGEAEAEVPNVVEAEGIVFRIVDNDAELEKRREKLRMQHGLLATGTSASATLANTQANAVGKKMKGGVGRSSSTKLERRRVGGNDDVFGGTEANLVSAHAPGRLNVDEIQAQVRGLAVASSSNLQGVKGGTSAAAPVLASGSTQKGWTTRTEKNLKKLRSGDGWSDDEDADARRRYTAVAGGGVAKTRELQFEPVVLDDVDMGRMRGVESVQRPGTGRDMAQQQPQPPHFQQQYQQHFQQQQHQFQRHQQQLIPPDESGVSKNVSLTSNAPGRKLRKGVAPKKEQPEPVVHDSPLLAPVPSQFRPAQFPQQAQSLQRNVSAGGYTSDTAIVAPARTGSTFKAAEILKPRRSMSLTSPPAAATPATVAVQNQYGATVLTAGGDNPSGTLAKGGWGSSNLARNTSTRSSASVPIARNSSLKVKAQASLGQGIASGLGPATRRSTHGESVHGHGTAVHASHPGVVDISPVVNVVSKTGKAQTRASVPYPMPGVPGAVAAAVPITKLPVPRAPPPMSSSSGMVMGKEGPVGSGNLLNIVEDAARGNRYAQEQMRVLKSGGTMGKMELQVVQAPKRAHRELLGSGLPGASSGTSSLGSSGAGLVRKSTGGSSRPAQSPLKSALRNPSGSRTPSPMGMQIRALAPLPTERVAQRSRMAAEQEEDEGESSAYETPGDGSGDDGRLRQASQVQAQAPTLRVISGGARRPAVGMNKSRPLSQPSPMPIPASTSAETPQRRKSVRVSLQPTFSPSPPTFYAEEDEAEPRGFWRPLAPDKPVRSRSKFLTQSLAGPLVATNRGGRDDIWQNSDDEDEEYTRAKMMLKQAGAEEKKVYATAAVLA